MQEKTPAMEEKMSSESAKIQTNTEEAAVNASSSEVLSIQEKETDKSFSLSENSEMEEIEVETAEVKEGEQTENTKKKSRKRKIWLSVISVVGAVVLFLGGFFTCWFSIDPELRALWAVKKQIDKEYYEEITDEKFYSTLFSAVNRELLDPYSAYMTADEYASNSADLAGSRSGLGLVFSLVDSEKNPQMLVTRVCGNSPAEKAGLFAGDYLIGFGKTQETVQNSVVFDEFESFLNERADSETFYVKVLRGDEEKTLALRKEKYVESYVFYRTNTHSVGFVGEEALNEQTGNNALDCLDAQTAYIRLTRFGGNAAKAFDLAMARFKTEGKKHLVLDLRGNGGGSLDAMLSISKYFCKTATESKPVIAVADYGERKEYFKTDDNLYNEYFSADSKILVLADGDSASASECLIGCMLDYGAIGYQDICLTERDGVAKTYGKGIMQTTYLLFANGKDAVRLTTAVICWPKGNCIHGRGVLPTDGAFTVQGTGYNEAEIVQAIAKWQK